jgi:Fe-S oxidoreductase
MVVSATSDAAFDAIVAAGGRRGQIYTALWRLRDDVAPLIKSRYPKIPRRVSGYSLDELLPEQGFNVARSLVGAEGTCVTLLRIKCRLVPHPAAKVLLILGYKDVYTAGDAVPDVLQGKPVGLEGFDNKLVQYIRINHIHEQYLHMLPEGEGWLLAEFGGDTPEAAEKQARQLMARFQQRGDAPAMHVVTDPLAQAHLWKVREAGLGATAYVPGLAPTHEGWEDAAVPPDHVGAYLRDFRGLLDRFNYDTSLYGHFGDGCIHCRINFDLTTHKGVAAYIDFIKQAADIVLAHGGSLSGEHGDGQSRGFLLEKMYGPELVQAFGAFKAIWDPDGMMNPGKKIHPFLPDANLREGPDHHPWTPASKLSLGDQHDDFASAATRCVGVGECRKHNQGTMCPSYMATRDEQHSTRGRARLLFEMTKKTVIRDGWRSGAVHDALDLCLACKACRSECPVHVDMASYKAEFMYHHYKNRLRPRAAYSMGLIWWWARAAGKIPRLANIGTQSALLAPAVKRLAGFAPDVAIPPFAAPSFRDWFARRRPQQSASFRGRVLLWPDTFNSYFTPQPLQATVAVLEAAGWRVEIPQKPLCCGRPLYSFGFLDTAARLWRSILETLAPYIEDGTPIVGVEPACVTAFRDELLQLRPRDRDARRLSQQVRHLSEFLVETGYRPPQMTGRAVFHAHCHHRAIIKTDAEVALLRQTGLDLEVLDAGCCGMAGDYGFRTESRGVARTIAERAFLPRMREADLAIVDGFSCREQARQGAGRVALTLPEVLRRPAKT